MKQKSNFWTLCSVLLLLSCNTDWEKKVISEVTDMEKLMVETQKKGDYETQLGAFSDSYTYIDINGNVVTKEELKKRRDDDLMYSQSINASNLEVIPLSPELALTRGRWDDTNLYYGGIPRAGASRYMAIWKKKWKLETSC